MPLGRDIVCGMVGVGVGVGLGVYIHSELRANVRCNHDEHRYLTHCTCAESQYIYCEKHDPSLLLTISANIPEGTLMTDLGQFWELNITII